MERFLLSTERGIRAQPVSANCYNITSITVPAPTDTLLPALQYQVPVPYKKIRTTKNLLYRYLGGGFEFRTNYLEKSGMIGPVTKCRLDSSSDSSDLVQMKCNLRAQLTTIPTLIDRSTPET